MSTSDRDEGLAVHIWRAPLARHALVLAVVLIVGVLIVGDQGVFSSDEGAGLAQARAVSEGSWGLEHPFGGIDPHGRWFPLEKAQALEEGGFAPLPKRPVYSWIAGQVWGVAGTLAVMTLSAVGTWVAAVAAALIARQLDASLDRPALWITGLASPLLADGFLVIAHSLAAAAGGVAAYSVVRWANDAPPRWLVGAGVAVAGGALLRQEVILLAAAMATCALVLGVAPSKRRWAVAGGVVAAALVAGMALDLLLSNQVFGSAGVAAPSSGTAASSSSYIADRLAAFVTTWLRPGYGDLGGGQLLGLVMALVGVLAVVAVRRREGRDVVITLWVGVGVLAILRLLLRAPDPDVVPGLLAAFPILLWGLGSLRRASLPTFAWWLAGSATLFALAVLATQYREGGAWEWGGRYFAVGLPLVVPLICQGGRDRLREVAGPTVRRVIVTATVVVILCSAAMQLLAVRTSHVRSRDLVVGVLEVAGVTPPGDGGLPVIISVDPELPRTAWTELDAARWLYVPPDDLSEVLERLSQVGVEQAVVATRRALEVAAAAPNVDFGSAIPLSGLWWFQPISTLPP